MISYFCPSCGVLRVGNTTRATAGDYNLTCDCGFTMRFYILSRQTKGTAVIEDEFIQTELTDSQRGSKRRNSSPKRT